MPAPNISGFFYDEEKKKYFKVLPSHINTGSKYNVDAVREKRKRDKVSDVTLLRVMKDTCP